MTLRWAKGEWVLGRLGISVLPTLGGLGTSICLLVSCSQTIWERGCSVKFLGFWLWISGGPELVESFCNLWAIDLHTTFPSHVPMLTAYFWRFFVLFCLNFIYLFLERGKGGRETLISCLSCVPRPGTEPKTQACAMTRNRTCDLMLCRTMPNQPSHMRQGETSEGFKTAR